MKARGLWIPALLFLFAFLCVPLLQLVGLKFIPGNIGDARLNNYFLENVYQYLLGRSESLWDLGFFWNFPYVIGFSDNLFGASPFYIFGRFLTGQPDTAFQIWFLFGYAANFFAAYYALRRLGGSSLASSLGALIFAFALPTIAHSGHAQLHYRFGVPLAITFFFLFLDRKDFGSLIIAGVWLVWQFYCGVYIGFFTLLMMVVMLAFYLGCEQCGSGSSMKESIRLFVLKWSLQSRQEKITVLLGILLLLGFMLLLLYPYLQVSRLYGVERSWDEISLMLPRPQSYFLADASHLWSFSSANVFANIPMRHEHQMFFGVVPMLLALTGFLIGSRQRNGQAYVIMAGSLGIVIAITLYVGGFSLWYLLHKLPLASAIRAMTRLDLVLLFPVAYLAVIAVDYICAKWRWGGVAIAIAILPVMIFEFSATTMGVSSKSVWRERLSAIEAVFPKHLSKDSILFFAQSNGPFYASELDAMWVSLIHGAKTLNGYSGSYPPGFSIEYGSDCSEMPRRVLSYLSFSSKNNDIEGYRGMMKRIVPVGFDNCDSNWLALPPPSSTRIDREYTADEVKNLSYRFDGRKQVRDGSIVQLTILNSGDLPIAAQSTINKPMRISWRFLDASGVPTSGWDTRKDLPFDIPANSDLTVQVPIDKKAEVLGGALQISLVQESVFWAHDIGIQPLTISWE